MAKTKKRYFRPVTRSPVKIIIASAMFTVFSSIIHNIFTVFGMGYYTEPKLNFLWSPLILAQNNPSAGLNHYYVFVAVTFIGAMLFSIMYTIIGRDIKAHPAKRGRDFGFFVFIGGIAPFMLSISLTLALPIGFLLLWSFENFIIYLVGGTMIGGILIAKNIEETEIKSFKPEEIKEVEKPDWVDDFLKS